MSQWGVLLGAIRAICHLPRTWLYDFYTDVGFQSSIIKGGGMGTLSVLVSPCFRKNVVVTCKIWVFFV